MASDISVRPLDDADRPWLVAVLEDWGMRRIVSRERLTDDVSVFPGFVAEQDGERVGLAVLRREEDALEVLALLSLPRLAGAGTALLEAVEAEARRTGCRRAWLITTNDNLDAVRFYQRRGWDLVALHRDAVTRGRALKPEIGEIGAFGIPIRHELEFELRT
jgi:N-acetylglutamate synthase-like GNAT family acetyltransferase